jgi:hypothetical protein
VGYDPRIVEVARPRDLEVTIDPRQDQADTSADQRTVPHPSSRQRDRKEIVGITLIQPRPRLRTVSRPLQDQSAITHGQPPPRRIDGNRVQRQWLAICAQRQSRT